MTGASLSPERGEGRGEGFQHRNRPAAGNPICRKAPLHRLVSLPRRSILQRMADEQRNKPRCLREDALAVLTRLRDAGHVAYFAGGCVRDVLLGLEPKDWDVATDAPPQRVRQLFSNTQAVGAAFGVILVRHRKSVIEVATFRAEGAYEDGRRPSEVHFTNAEEDAKRRDFTINGLFLDPIANQVIDYVGGQVDLKNRVLRAIGNPDERFAEDHLRLLRAVRFSARFSLNIESTTAQAIAKHAGHLKRISPERIAEELRMMLTPASRSRAWLMLRQYGLDEVIFRFLKDDGPKPHPETSGRRGVLLFDQVAPQSPIPFGLALAAASLEYVLQQRRYLAEWLKQINVRRMVKAMRQALKISNEEADMMEGTLYGVELLLTDRSPSVSKLKRFLARPTAALSRSLIDALPLDRETAAYRETLQQQLRDLEQTEYAPTPFITGDDLTAAGLQPGPMFKRVLEQVYDAQLEDRVTSKDQAMELALKLARE